MHILADLYRMTRNGVTDLDLDIERLAYVRPDPRDALGSVPIAGHGQLTAQELASAAASIAVDSGMTTMEKLLQDMERTEVVVRRVAADASTRGLGGSYWDTQSADVDLEEEIERLAGEMQPLGYVEGASVVGWVIRNAAVRAQRPISRLARSNKPVSADAMALAETLLNSAQRLDPTFGGHVFSLRPRRSKRLRFRDRFGQLWVYGD